jgi:hypothetical protein
MLQLQFMLGMIGPGLPFQQQCQTGTVNVINMAQMNAFGCLATVQLLLAVQIDLMGIVLVEHAMQ